MKIVILAYFLPAIWQVLGKSPIVDTPLGKIEGITSNIEFVRVKKFLGIPFAKPPLGSLRFLRPEPVEPWNDVLQAKTQPPGCIQYTKQPFPWYDGMPGKSEDCLYLNVFAPSRSQKGSKLAVLFWIFGGGLTLGSNRLDVYDASSLAKRENVIVVTVNYRLGLFGFLTSNTSDAPGNVGLYDAVMALQWVNDYIENFGGDKDRIAIVGESAGSIVVSILCVSPLSKGLFSRAILQSGSTVKYTKNPLDFNLEFANKIAESVGCATEDSTIYNDPATVVGCLRNTNATYLVKTQWSFNPLSSNSFSPQYGDTLLPNNAVDDIRDGKFHNVPILAGNVRDEGSVFLTSGNPDVFGFYGEKDPKINKTYGAKLMEGTFMGYTDPQKYIDFYLKDVPDDDYDAIRKQTYDAYGDTSILCDTVYFAESYAERKNDVYYYYLTHRPSNSMWAEWMGVAHFDDVQFVFGRPVRVPADYTIAEVWLSGQIMKMWANFAKNGYPGVVLNWPKYSKENHTYVNIDVHQFGSLNTGPHLKNCNFLRSQFGF